MKQDYVISVSGAPGSCWVAGASDEQDPTQLVTTADLDMAWRIPDFVPARAELRRLVKLHPSRSFRLDVVPNGA